ncbi:endoribonuclease l-PSP domain-containing protein [Pochonia chlamydosporia 170]|uniref:Endoribonuclease l-PSP domain-containing protein n=1 Tax=Pochonia chlamydosporia 170 TaxID=1380566 RepID=A0A179F1H3_METCM|nr:endoribonuclease l-PSP domain-containing protein [Pochonia chlamydosporia 170]OAQ59110.2 endoribonuclease l-PSP domain-containing protein [Pochonia chlamydosporia 170]
MEYKQNTFRSSGFRSFNPNSGFANVGNELGLSQAIIIPPNASLVVTSGQCGFKNDLSLPVDVREQVMLAWENADKTLKAAGVVEGWKNVYQIASFAPSLNDEWVDAMMEAKAKWMGDNRPAWTGVAVAGLYNNAAVEMTFR